jgi:hypothetical protein
VRAAALSTPQVPEDLQQIRAFVRWEEAGKPNNTSPEWQQARALPCRRAASRTLRRPYGHFPHAHAALSARPRASAAPALRSRAREQRCHATHTPGLTRCAALARDAHGTG